MTRAFHQVALRQRVRRVLLQIAGRLPLRPARPAATERILLIRPDHIGDVLLTTPALQALRRARPGAEIHALVGAWSADVLASYPEVDQILTLPFPAFDRSPADEQVSPYRLLLRAAGHLRRVGYTSAVILRPDHWWGALLTFFVGIPERIGYAHPDVAPFLTRAHPLTRQHAVRQNLTLVERWTRYLPDERAPLHFPVNPLDRADIDADLAERGIAADAPLLVIHPGSGTWVKRWETARWATVADTLAEQLGTVVVLTGSAGERPLAHDILTQMHQPAHSLVGEVSLTQLAALYSRARLVLGPDSGPLHLAVAVGTPTVTLFGPADPVEFAPWGDSSHHIALMSGIGCRPCRVLDWGNDDPVFHPCVRDITVAQVLTAAHRVTQQSIA